MIIKFVGIRLFKMRLFNIIRLLLFIFVLAPCSQTIAETNAVDTARIDTFIPEDVIVKELSNGIRHRRLKFKIGSPMEGPVNYKHINYKEVDSIACSFNKWSYAPDAVYLVDIKENDVYEDDVVVYRNGIKIMESSFYCGESATVEKTYYYSDGKVAFYDMCKLYCGEISDEPMPVPSDK